MKYKITNTSSGVELGIYEGNTREEALDALAVFSGYRDYDHILSIVTDNFGEIAVEKVEEQCAA